MENLTSLSISPFLSFFPLTSMLLCNSWKVFTVEFIKKTFTVDFVLAARKYVLFLYEENDRRRGGEHNETL